MKQTLRRPGGFVLAGIGLAVLALGLGGRSWLNTNGNVIYAFQGNLFSTPAKPRQVVVLSYTFQNRSGRTLTLDSVAFPRGMPAHLRLVAELAAYGAKEPMGEYIWPPRTLVGTIEGYTVAPHEYVNILIAVSATTSGIYIVGPVSLQAHYPLAMMGVPVEVTNTEGRALCVNVRSNTCGERAVILIHAGAR